MCEGIEMSLLDLLHTLFYFLLALGILITFHEYGHYWVAKRCAVRVERFSIGFGRKLLHWRRHDTEFVIATIPLGGYVKMFGDHSGRKEEALLGNDKLYSFDHKTVWQRIAIVMAGPLANFVLAFLLFYVLTLVGRTEIVPVISQPDNFSVAQQAGLKEGDEILAVDGVVTINWATVYQQLVRRIGDTGSIILQVRSFDTQEEPHIVHLPVVDWLSTTINPQPLLSLGLRPYRPDIPAVIGEVIAHSRAQSAGLREGDKIISVNGQSIDTWEQWRMQIRNNPEQALSVVVKRQRETGEEYLAKLIVIPERSSDDGTHGAVGVIAQVSTLPATMQRKLNYNIFQAAVVATSKTYSAIVVSLLSLKKMLLGQMSIKNLSGPVGIAQYTGMAASAGWYVFVNLLAILSVSLGVLNLLPIPSLDGGRLMFYAYEVIVGRPLMAKYQAIALRFGILMIASLIVLALYNDLSKI